MTVSKVSSREATEMEKCTDCGKVLLVGPTGQCHQCWEADVREENEDVLRVLNRKAADRKLARAKNKIFLDLVRDLNNS